MGLLELVEKHVEMRKVGGEWHGACPDCGCGENGPAVSDRFTVKADGRWFCRNCGNGDTVSFLRKFEQMSCPEAHAAAGKMCTSTTCPVSDKCRMGNGAALPQKSRYATPEPVTVVRAATPFAPGQAISPAEIWRQKAEALVTEAHAALLASPSELTYLAGRGLPLEAVIKNRLGWNGTVIYKSRASWGLPESLNTETGKPKKLWVPRGIVIPTYLDGAIHRVRIRVPKVDRSAKVPGYVAVSGSGDDIVSLHPAARAFVVVEADLDAMLIDWVAGDIVGAVALVSADVKPKMSLALLLEKALAILVATDFDPRANSVSGKYENPGGKAARWWLKNYPRAKRWPVPAGKDPGDALAAGVDIRGWVLAGLPTAMTISLQMGSKTPDVVVDQLRRHITSGVESPFFDIAKAQQVISDNFRLISSRCPVGAMEWIAQTRADIFERMKQTAIAVDAAFDAGDGPELERNLSLYRHCHVEAFELFEAHLPMTEVDVEMQQLLSAWYKG